MYLTFFSLRRQPLGDVSQSLARGPMPLRIITGMLSRLATTAVIFASLVSLTWVGDHAGALDPDSPPGLGIIVHTEITAIWLPRPLLELARDQLGSLGVRSPEELRTCLGRNGWTTAWYALTYRADQVNGQYGEFTQIRPLSDSPDYLGELQAVMATAAGRPTTFESPGFSQARVEVIPDELQAFEPREAITRIMSRPVVRDELSSTGGSGTTRRSV
jgi:hypothetical protein